MAKEGEKVFPLSSNNSNNERREERCCMSARWLVFLVAAATFSGIKQVFPQT